MDATDTRGVANVTQSLRHTHFIYIVASKCKQYTSNTKWDISDPNDAINSPRLQKAGNKISDDISYLVGPA